MCHGTCEETPNTISRSRTNERLFSEPTLFEACELGCDRLPGARVSATPRTGRDAARDLALASGQLHLTSPHLTSPHLTSPHLTSPHLTSPHLTSPQGTSPHLTSPHLTSPHLTSPHLTSPHLTSPHLTSPHLTSPQGTSPHLTSSHLTSPHYTLVTWHQSKNPQDGSCGTDCPHALPRSKPVVIRRDSSCVFPVSGRAHPARQPSRTPPWARHAILWGTDAPTWPPPTARRQRSAGSVVGYHRGAADEYVRHCDATARVERHRGTAPTALRRHGAGSVAGHHRGAANVPVRRRVARPSGQSAVVARPSRQSAAVAPPKQSSANGAPLQWQHTTVVQSTCTCAAVAQCSGHGAVVAVPGQPYASVAPVQWQSAIVVLPTYTCAIVAPSSGQSATAALPTQPCADVAPVQ